MATLVKRGNKYYSKISIRVGDRKNNKRKIVYVKLLSEKHSDAKIRNAIVTREENKIRKEIIKGQSTKADLININKNIEWEWIKFDGTVTSLKIHTISDYIDNFINYKKIQKNRTSTIEYYFNSLNKFVNAIGSNVLLSDISIEHIDIFKEYMVGNNLSETSIDSYSKGVKIFLNWCLERNYISKVPIIEYINPIIEDKWLTENEYNLIINYDNYTDSRFPKMFKLYGETGMRLSEGFFGILTEDDNGIWLAIPNKASKSGKGRTIQLNQEQKKTVQLIQNLYKNKDQYRYYSRIFKKVKDSLNIPKHKSFHSLRHYFGKTMVTKTGNIYQVSGMMGHSSIKVTEDNYVKGFDLKSTLRDFPSLKPYLINVNNEHKIRWDTQIGIHKTHQIIN